MSDPPFHSLTHANNERTPILFASNQLRITRRSDPGCNVKELLQVKPVSQGTISVAAAPWSKKLLQWDLMAEKLCLERETTAGCINILPEPLLWERKKLDNLWTFLGVLSMQRSLEWRQRTQQKSENVLLRDFLYSYLFFSILLCRCVPVSCKSPRLGCVLKCSAAHSQLCASPGGRAARDLLLCQLNCVYHQLGSPAQYKAT